MAPGLSASVSASQAPHGEAVQVDPGLTLGWPLRGRAWCQRSQLKYDEALSSFGFKFNLRRYIAVPSLLLTCSSSIHGRGRVRLGGAG